MKNRNERRGDKRLAGAKKKLAENPGAMFERVVSEQEVNEACTFLRHVWRDRIFTPLVTLWTFLGQVLSADSSCREAVARVLSFLSRTKGLDASHDPGAYGKARKRLPEKLLPALTRTVAGKLEEKLAPDDLWHGHRVKLLDGSSVNMPDTAANQAAYPQHTTQKPGCGLPTARIVGIFSLLTGALVDFAIAALRVAETTLFRQIAHAILPGEIALADRYFCSYADIALLRRRGVESVFRLHQSRAVDFRKGKRLGHQDRLVEWHKGPRPQWMTCREFDALPDTMGLRMLRFACEVPGWRTETITVVTTLLDPEAYPARDLANLFRRRWEIETDLGHVKTTMKMDFLRTKSPEMVRKEIWAHLLAYNLIRTLMWDAAEHRRHLSPLRLSFKGAMQEMMALWPFSASAARQRDLTAYYDALLRAIATHKVPHRPDRSEPRVRKRRPKSYPLMTRPRPELKKELLAAHP
jgi:hypothetical protein